MRKFKVAVLEQAKADMREARGWYNNQQSGLGKRLTADMTVTLLKIAANPTSFAIRYQKIRLANFETFPYAIHFYIDEKNSIVYIIAIMHNRRHPDTPKNRL